MTEINESSSGSDMSSGSWTLLDDSLVTGGKKPESSESVDEVIEINQENSTKHTDNAQEANRKRSDGFLTFDEYLQERLLEHDYEQEEKPQKLRKYYREKLRRGIKKCKAQRWGILALVTIVLTLSAFATLCSTFSQPLVEKAAELEVRYDHPLKRENSTHYHILEKVNETIRDLEALKTTKLLEPLQKQNKVNATTTTEERKPIIKPDKEVKIIKPDMEMKIIKPDMEMKIIKPDKEMKIIKPDKETKTPPLEQKKDNQETKKQNPFAPKILKCDSAGNFMKGTKIKPKLMKTKWMILKEFLLDTNLHALVSLVMTNIYLFTLLADFARKPSQKNSRSKCLLKQRLLEDLEKSDNIEEVRKYLFKELPFWNAEFTHKDHKKKKVEKTNATEEAVPKRTQSSVAVFDERKKLVKSLLFKSCPFFSETALSPILVPPKNDETGQSECQRRFEELDHYQKKFESLKQAQRSRIRLLKQKFRNEVSHIKDTEVESEARAEKINRTSQMFIRKLKFNREKYLLELKKVRELRQKVTECRKREIKDAAVGSYTVTLPPIYDYGERFRIIKSKFEREHDKVPGEFKFH